MKNNFARCLAEVLKHEGGYVNHPADPGGETNFGISKRAYPAEDIKGMTKKRAGEIYRRDYWNKVKGDDLPSGLDLVAFDGAVNSGVSRGAKWLQAAVGANADGKVGAATVAAANRADLHRAINAACDARMAFLRGLKTWPTFGKGWTRRVDSVRAVAMSLAGAPATAPEPVPAPSAPAKPLPPSRKTGLAGLLAVIAAAMAAFAKAMGWW